MKKEEKELLRELVGSSEGLLSVQVFTEGSKRRIAQKLIALDFVKEFQYKNIPSCRATKKGYLMFDPLFVRAWTFFTDDMAKILSIIAIVISILVGLKQIGLL
jgi:hypothetical protein